MKTIRIDPSNPREAAIILDSLQGTKQPEPVLLAVIETDGEPDPSIMNRLMELQQTSIDIYVLFGTKDDYVDPGAENRQSLLVAAPSQAEGDSACNSCGKEDPSL